MKGLQSLGFPVLGEGQRGGLCYELKGGISMRGSSTPENVERGLRTQPRAGTLFSVIAAIISVVHFVNRPD